VESVRSPFRRLVVPLVAALVAATMVGGCSGNKVVGRGPAAVVNGEEISQATVTELLDAQKRYYESLDDPAAAERLAEFMGPSGNSFAMAEAARSLESWINFTIARQHLKASKRPVTDEDLAAARSEIEGQLQGQEIAIESVDKALLDFTVESAATTTALRALISEQVAKDNQDKLEGRIKALFDELAPQRPLCLNIIVSETEADARAALARVEAGEDFGAVAAEVSADPQTAEANGYAGCASPEQASQAFGGDFTDVEVGDTFGPSQQNEVFVVVEVGSTTGPTIEQMRPELERQVTAIDDQEVTTRLAKLVTDAKVTVDPRYGTWNPDTGTVDPPEAPTPASTTTSTTAAVEAIDPTAAGGGTSASN